jgi:rare lipoprotein A
LTKRKSYNAFFIKFFVILCIAVLSSCASAPYVDHSPGERGTYVVASWYGKKFNGRPTASGKRFDMYAMTCAHKTFKFGTKLRVTNPDNNKSVIVTVNDRGPFIRGRDLDLSYGAAKKIGIVKKGVARVKMEHIY